MYKGFKRTLVDSCEAPARSCQHLNFCFPGKTEHFYWLRTKELCWEASAVSFNFFYIFLSTFAWIFSAALKTCKNSNVFYTLPERYISRPLFLKSLWLYSKLSLSIYLFIAIVRGHLKKIILKSKCIPTALCSAVMTQKGSC